MRGWFVDCEVADMLISMILSWSADFHDSVLLVLMLCWCLTVFEEELWYNSRFILSKEVSSGKRSTLDVLPKPPKWGNSRIETSSNDINIWGPISNQGSRGHSGLSSKRCITNLGGNSKHEKPFRWLLYAVERYKLLRPDIQTGKSRSFGIVIQEVHHEFKRQQ